MNLTAIREAIVSQVTSGVDVPINAYAYLPSSPQFPYFAPVAVGDYVSYHESFDSAPGVGGAATVQLELLIVESGESDDAGRFVDAMLSTGTGRSVIEAIEADKTLGGVVQSCICLKAVLAPFGLVNVPGYVARVPLSIVTFKESA